MMLANFTALTFPHSLGGTFDRDPRAVVWHRTEASNIAGAVSVYKSKLACPHMTVDMDTQEKVQHVPLDKSCYALRNLEGGCDTNTTGIIQVEIVGFSADSWTVSPHQLQWLGEEVLKPIFEACPSIPRGPVYSGARMTCAEWDVWSGGMCGHRDVPEQDHTDPGDLNLTQIVAYATGEDMALTDDDVHRISEAVWSRQLDARGFQAPAAQMTATIYDEIRWPENLEARLVAAVVAEIKRLALIVDEGH